MKLSVRHQGALLGIPLLFAAYVCMAEQGVTDIQAVPNAVVVGRSTVLTISARVAPDQNLLADMINLVRDNANQRPISPPLGRMYDDGTHGDAIAGDNVFTAQTTVMETEPTTLYFEVSAAYGGDVAGRVRSVPVRVDVIAAPPEQPPENPPPVNPPPPPTQPPPVVPRSANAQIVVIDGASSRALVDNSLADSDFIPGEDAKFDGSKSTGSSGAPIQSYEWFVGSSSTTASTKPIFTARLPDGAATIRLKVTDVNGVEGVATVSVTVNAPQPQSFSKLTDLTANQRSVAQALDNICTSLSMRLQQQQSLNDDQQDLLDRCKGILAADVTDQRRALDELSAQDFNAARTQTLLFTNSLYAGVMDRLMALRGGARGLSLAAFDVEVGGKSVPTAEIERTVGQLLGSGASADDTDSLFGDKLGAWSRGNFTFGSKDASQADHGFDGEQYSFTAGLDYRLSDRMVIGGALAYGSSNISYDPNGEGGLDTKTWAVSIYGSRYAAKNFYLDALFNAANSSYDSQRLITYNEVLNGVRDTVQREARGNTHGLTLSGGLSGGYDFLYKGFTLSPNAGFFYVDSQIDAFREQRSRGLNLVYDAQTFQSLTTTLGIRVNYAWNLSWGVILPYFRGDYVRELKNDVEAFNVHFASDPGNPASVIAVKSDDPDQSYLRLAAGLSAQLPFGIAGYIEYQVLQGFEFVTFNDVSAGLRMQYKF